MVFVPMLRDIHTAADPDLIVLFYVVEEAL